MTSFTEFWSHAIYIRGRLPNGGRKNAEKAWNGAIKKGVDPHEIIAGYLGFEEAMMAIGLDNQYRPMVATWVNRWSWEQHLGEDAAKRYLARPKLEVVK